MTPSPHLSQFDRALRLSTRWLTKPLLASTPPHGLLRALAETTAHVGSRPPPGTQQEWHGETLWITPPGVAADADVLVYIHGGGFVLGSPRTHSALAAHLAKAAGLRAALPRYPLAPEAPFPAARDACISAWDAICDAGRTPVALAGDSAGACLALQVALAARDRGHQLPRRLGLVSPVADLTGTAPELLANRHSEHLIAERWARASVAQYLNGADPSNPAVSPLFADLSGLPPASVQYAETEVLAGDAKRLADKLGAQVHPLPDLPHVFHIYAGVSPAANSALTALGTFLGGAD